MTNEGEDEDKNKKIMGIKDVMEEETNERNVKAVSISLIIRGVPGASIGTNRLEK